MLRLRPVAILCLAVLLSTPLGAPAADTFTVELAGFMPTVHPSPTGAQPGRPSGTAGPSSGHDWQAQDRSFSLAEVRLTLPLGSCELIAQADRMPQLSRELRSVVFVLPPGGGVVPSEIRRTSTAHLESFDVALGLPLTPSSVLTVTPWVGLSHVRTTLDDELTGTWNSQYAGEKGGIVPVTATSTHRIDGRLLGLVAGVEARWEPVSGRWLSLRGAARWVGGRETAQSAALQYIGTPEDPPPADAERTTSRSSRQTSRLIVAAEAAFGVRAGERVAIAAGWLFRDYSDNGGPARINGPFLRAIVTF